MPIKRVLRIFRYRGLNPLHTFHKEATVTGRFLFTGPDAIRKQGMLRIYDRAGFAFSRSAISSSGQRFFEEDGYFFFVQ